MLVALSPVIVTAVVRGLLMIWKAREFGDRCSIVNGCPDSFSIVRLERIGISPARRVIKFCTDGVIATIDPWLRGRFAWATAQRNDPGASAPGGSSALVTRNVEGVVRSSSMSSESRIARPRIPRLAIRRFPMLYDPSHEKGIGIR